MSDPSAEAPHSHDGHVSGNAAKPSALPPPSRAARSPSCARRTRRCISTATSTTRSGSLLSGSTAESLRDEELAAIIQRPARSSFMFFMPKAARRAWPNSTCATTATGQLAYFGLMPEAVGKRLGYFFLYHAFECLGAADLQAAGQHLHAGSPARPAALPAHRFCRLTAAKTATSNCREAPFLRAHSAPRIRGSSEAWP